MSEQVKSNLPAGDGPASDADAALKEQSGKQPSDDGAAKAAADKGDQRSEAGDRKAAEDLERVTVERDTLQGQVTTITAERDTAVKDRDAFKAEVDRLAKLTGQAGHAACRRRWKRKTNR